jgi:hypothetical protein
MPDVFYVLVLSSSNLTARISDISIGYNIENNVRENQYGLRAKHFDFITITDEWCETV